MKNLYVIMFFTVILGSWNLNASAQNVSFPDANLAAKVRTALGLASGANIPLTSLQGLDSLSANSAAITNLIGLEQATGLERLYLNNNEISDISPLSGLTNLDILHLGNNEISDIGPFSGLTSLMQLNLNDNEISDISPLSGLTSLMQLWLENNPISNFDPLRNLTNLRTLLLRGTTFSDFTILSPLTSLDALGLGENEISDLTGFPALPNLTSLSLHDNQISDLSPLENLTSPTKLEDLGLTRNQITNITPIARFIGLTQLWLENNKIRDVTPLGNLINLQWRLVINNNQVRDLSPLSSLTKLVRLHFEGNQVRDLSPLSSLTELTDLRFDRNQVRDLSPLSSLTKLQLLAICYNPYTDISPLSALEELAALRIDEVFVKANEALVESIIGEDTRLVLCPPLPTQPTTSGGGGGGGGGGRTISKLSFPGQIGFSELMFASGGGLDSLPQWIELCNASDTETVNLWRWQLEIEARNANGEHQHVVITFEDLLIPPNQTALIVTSEAPNSVGLSKERIYNFSTHHPNTFKDNEDHNRVLGQNGFFLKLSDPGGAVSDVAGNLDGDSETEDAPAWELPTGMTPTAARTSVFRHYDLAKGTPLDGEISENWVRAADVQLEFITYWGKYTDIGNPGRKGGWKFPFGRISISELMFTSRGGLPSLPQWIELYNTSDTQTVDLRGWQLKIEARDDDGEHRYAVITLDSFLIPPNQMALIVTSIARSSGVRQGVYNLPSRHPDAFKLNRHQNQNQVLGQSGFFLKLSDPDGIVTDIAGNLDGNKLTEDKPKWELPAGITPDGARTSLVRRYYRAADIPLDGKKSASWVPASEMALKVMTYYGRSTDIGNPGYTDAGVLPPGRMSISELMFTSRGGLHSLPQWIELYNGSETETVNLRGWQLEIEARDANDELRHEVVTFNNLSIPPNQAALLVTWHSSRSSGDIPRDRIYRIRSRDRNRLLGQTGFSLRLSDPDGAVSDVAGNLDGDRLTKDPPEWELPAGITPDGARTSLLRQYHEIGMPVDGQTSASWMPASRMPLKVMTYWGKETDIGNPGYANEETLLPGHQVSFSELMFTSRGGLHSLPQWIELYNDSETETVNLRGWQLEIEARDANGEHRHAVIPLYEFSIPPNQTALIVTWNGRDSGDIPRDRVYNFYQQNAFDRNQVLGQRGFFLKLSDPDGGVSDIAGNLDGDKKTKDEPAWQLPAGSTTDDGVRTSLMRRYYHVTGIPLDGRTSANWVPASNVPLKVMTYWGKETDIGNPGYRGGGPLPVELSRFRPERTDTGQVVIKWTTASELNNAGFNILRSQTRKAQFVRINPKLIAGQGTSSEMHTYSYTDTTAKPNVIYYYRIEDVSFEGVRQTLATVRLKGYVSASAKMLQKWGELKSQE